MVLRFWAYGPSAYLRSIWDFLDGIIMFLSIVDSFSYLAQNQDSYGSRATLISSASAFRVLRLLVVSQYWTALGDLFKVMRNATNSVWALLLLLAIVTYMFAVIGTMMLGGKLSWEARANFNDFPHAFFTVLQASLSPSKPLHPMCSWSDPCMSAFLNAPPLLHVDYNRRRLGARYV